MKIGKLITSFALVGVFALMGTVFTIDSVKYWYPYIEKPEFTPPSWIFGPVWTILFILMGVALYLIWKKGMNRADVRSAFWLFLFHLIFNASWSLFFFAMQSPRAGFINIILLWVLIGLVVFKFWKVDKWAGLLLIPYWVWVTFAAILNYHIWQLN